MAVEDPAGEGMHLNESRIASVRRKVNWLVIMRRKRWCSGSSVRANITGTLLSASVGMIASGIVFADSRGSTSAALMSSYRLTTQTGLPPNIALRSPGRSRHWANSAGGASGQCAARGRGSTGSSVSDRGSEVVEVNGISH